MKSESPEKRQAGFSLVEIAVGLVVIGLVVISISNVFISIGVIQRQSAHLSLAARLAEQKIESLRNNHYNTIPLSPPPIDFTSELPADLATPRSATVNVSEPSPGIKRLEVTITYREGSRSKTVQLSVLLGNIGISQ